MGLSLRLEQVSKSYRDPDGRSVPVLSDLSAEIKPGEVWRVKGAVGGRANPPCSTMLSGLLLPDTGSILADGKAINTWSETRRDAFRGRPRRVYLPDLPFAVAPSRVGKPGASPAPDRQSFV